MVTDQPAGSLLCLGLGITLGSQLTILAREQLAAADVVFFHSNSHYLAGFLRQINPSLVDLQPFYQAGESRSVSYQAMLDILGVPANHPLRQTTY